MTGHDHSPGFLALVDATRRDVREIDAAEYVAMRERGDEHLLIDVREDNEYAAGHAEGAKHLSRGIIERDIEKEIPDKSARMVLYCGGGFRSALAAASLQKMGYTGVISLNGGWRAYEEAGLPVWKP